MSERDILHDVAKNALITDKWTIDLESGAIKQWIK